MNEALIIFSFCLALGSIIGVLAGLLGIGGGLLMVPACLYLFDVYLQIPITYSMPMAIATSLASIIFTSAASARAHYRKQNVATEHLPSLTGGVIVGAVIGACAVTRVDGSYLQIVFGALVIVTAFQMAFYTPKVEEHVASSARLVGVGGAVGSLASLLGVGGGAFMVPALTWLNIDIKRSIGSASFCGSIIAIVATVVFVLSDSSKLPQSAYTVGYVYLPAMVGVVLTSGFTARYGAALVMRLPVKRLKKIFALFLLCVGSKMLSPLVM